MPDRKYYVVKSRYHKKYYETHKRVTLTLKKEDYEKLDKIASSYRLTVQDFLYKIAFDLIKINDIVEKKVRERYGEILNKYEEKIQELENRIRELEEELARCKRLRTFYW